MFNVSLIDKIKSAPLQEPFSFVCIIMHTESLFRLYYNTYWKSSVGECIKIELRVSGVRCSPTNYIQKRDFVGWKACFIPVQRSADAPITIGVGTKLERRRGCWLLVTCCWVLVAGCPEYLFEYYTDELKPSTIPHVMGVPFWRWIYGRLWCDYFLYKNCWGFLTVGRPYIGNFQ